MSNLQTTAFVEHQTEKCDLCGGHGFVCIPSRINHMGEVTDDREEQCVCQLRLNDPEDVEVEED